MDDPAQDEPGPRPDTQPGRPAAAGPPQAPPPAAADEGSRDPAAAGGDRELSDEDYARYEPL